MKNPLYLFAWFLKYTFVCFNDGYDLHKDISVNFAEYIPEDELEEKKQILRDTPGPAGVKYAIYVGNKLCGGVGALCATLGVLLPMFAFTGIFILIYDVLKHLGPDIAKWVNPNASSSDAAAFGNVIETWFNYFFNGMSAAALGLIVAQMIKAAVHNKTNRRTLVFILPFAFIYVFAASETSPVWFNHAFFAVMVACAIFAAVMHIRIQKKAEERLKDPEYQKTYDPYSKKAVRERDRKLREEEEELQREAKKKREQRQIEEKEKEKQEKQDSRKNGGREDYK